PWTQDVTDVITRVGVRWVELGTDTGGKPTELEHTAWVTDPGTEALSGVRSLTVGTSLTTLLDAGTIGGHVAGRTFGPAWRIEGLTVLESALADTATTDTGVSPAATLARLLDGTARIGLFLNVSGLPGWAPNQIGGAALVYL